MNMGNIVIWERKGEAIDTVRGASINFLLFTAIRENDKVKRLYRDGIVIRETKSSFHIRAGVNEYPGSVFCLKILL